MISESERMQAVERAELAADMAIAFFNRLQAKGSVYIKNESAVEITAAWVRAGMPTPDDKTSQFKRP